MAAERTNGSAEGFDNHQGRTSDDYPVIITDDGTIQPDSGDGIPVIEPATITAEPDSGEPVRRRGRKPGSKNRVTTERTQKQKGEDLAGLLAGLHAMGSALLAIPELELDEKEAKALGEKLARLNELYGMPVVSEKTQAWIGLGMAGFMIYGPRYKAWKIRVEREAKEKKAMARDIGSPGSPTIPGIVI